MTAMSTTTTSPFLTALEPITETDDELRAILEAAELPPLLPAIAYATGDLSLLRDDLRPDPVLAAAMPQGGLTDEQQAQVRELALAALVRFRDGGCVPAPPPTEDDLLAILEHAVGVSGLGDYLGLIEEELAFRDEDRRAPDWHIDQVAPGSTFEVAIIGAGMSGILAAHRLTQAGVAFTIYEKSDDVGGTWYDNQYPGCRVDNPNHNYSYAFAQRHDWPLHFSTQDVLHDYFRRCADAFGLRDHICFETEVRSCTWSDDDLKWTVEVAGRDGAVERHVVDAVISAVGQLNRPNYPDIPGRDDFAGPAFHSARWDASVDLVGKRVAIIGTGASAMQLVPEIAGVVGHLTVFQRTPAWMGPTPEYHDEVPSELRWLYNRLPSYSEWHRIWIFWRMGDGALETVRVDEEWEPKDRSVSMVNEFARQILTAYIEAEFADRPDLLAVSVPDYPVGAKRIIRDNGVWAGALKRPNVRLVTTGIERITETGIVTTDGEHHEVDVLIYGTGFKASEFLTPMRVSGRDGADLHETWGGDARAYLGVTIPGFPNLFCLYGPNTNIVVNGSIIYFSECGVRYILGLLGHLLAEGGAALDVRRDVHDEFNVKVDAGNDGMAWGRSSVNSWYKNAHGHVAQNWPFTLLEYWQRTSAPDPDDYEVLKG
jgi:4-hydroxyacetophenone monooxygenase